MSRACYILPGRPSTECCTALWSERGKHTRLCVRRHIQPVHSRKRVIVFIILHMLRICVNARRTCLGFFKQAPGYQPHIIYIVEYSKQNPRHAVTQFEFFFKQAQRRRADAPSFAGQRSRTDRAFALAPKKYYPRARVLACLCTCRVIELMHSSECITVHGTTL